MTPLEIIRAWKDGEYRLSMSADQRPLSPEQPAGLIELTNAVLELVAGGQDGTTRGKPSGCDTLDLVVGVNKVWLPPNF
jgi:mersacidin/lichenicidin family type 2 lantibiotic